MKNLFTFIYGHDENRAPRTKNAQSIGIYKRFLLHVLRENIFLIEKDQGFERGPLLSCHWQIWEILPMTKTWRQFWILAKCSL